MAPMAVLLPTAAARFAGSSGRAAREALKFRKSERNVG
jgi:hypothetical protein